MFIKNILFQMTYSEFLQKDHRKERKKHKIMNSTYYLQIDKWMKSRKNAPLLSQIQVHQSQVLFVYLYTVCKRTVKYFKQQNCF